jgi:DNA-binding transcriptional regulator PaaX
MINIIYASRRENEISILSEIGRKTAQGALIALLKNALLSNTRHLRGELIKLSQRNGYSAAEARTALYLIEQADWLRSEADGLEVYLCLTEHARLSEAGGA